eukprot:495498-Amphidinium_carterae.1
MPWQWLLGYVKLLILLRWYASDLDSTSEYASDLDSSSESSDEPDEPEFIANDLLEKIDRINGRLDLKEPLPSNPDDQEQIAEEIVGDLRIRCAPGRDEEIDVIWCQEMPWQWLLGYVKLLVLLRSRGQTTQTVTHDEADFGEALSDEPSDESAASGSHEATSDAA